MLNYSDWNTIQTETIHERRKKQNIHLIGWDFDEKVIELKTY